MVPKIVAKGCSFKGASAYLLHDKDHAQSNERVDWTAVRNLSADEPDLAWRIMAATALDQNRLKDLAGIKSTGRKSAKSVLHMSLAWHPDEKDELTREEMMRAAIGALKSIGAENHQALIIAHNDEPHPHLHILCNRISPIDGRMLPSSKEKLNLSKWAQAYEEERGQIYCEDRVLNNEARENGEYTRGKKSRSHRLVDEYKVVTDGKSNEKFKAHQLKQQDRNAELAKRGRDMARRHAAEQQALESTFYRRRDRIAIAERNALFSALSDVRDLYRPLRGSLLRKHRAQIKTFDKREKTAIGQIQNAIDALNMRSLVRDNTIGQTVGRSFKLLASKGARRSALVKRQAREKRSLLREQRSLEHEAKKTIQRRCQQLSKACSQRFLVQQSSLRHSQEIETRELQRDWRQRARERKKDWNALIGNLALSDEMRRSFENSASSNLSKSKSDKVRIRKMKIKERFRKARDKDRER